MSRIVIALGGNALGNTPYEQLELVTETAKPIVDLIEAGNEVIIAHGNGPQVGMINLAMSAAAEAGDPDRILYQSRTDDHGIFRTVFQYC